MGGQRLFSRSAGPQRSSPSAAPRRCHHGPFPGPVTPPPGGRPRTPRAAVSPARLRSGRRAGGEETRHAPPPSRPRTTVRGPGCPSSARPRPGVTDPAGPLARPRLGDPAVPRSPRGRGDGTDPGGLPGERGHDAAAGGRQGARSPRLRGRDDPAAGDRRHDPAADGRSGRGGDVAPPRGRPHRGPADDRPTRARPVRPDRPRRLPHPRAARAADPARRRRVDRPAPPGSARPRRGNTPHLPRDAGQGRQGGGHAAGLRRAHGRSGRRAHVVRDGGPLPGDPRRARRRRGLRAGGRRRPRGARGDDLGGGRRLRGAHGRHAVPRPSRSGLRHGAPTEAHGRRLDHLHVGLDGQAQGRGHQPRGGRGLRRRRGRPVPAERADRPRRPGAGRPVGRLRRVVRGDVARLALRRVPGARPPVAGEGGRRAGPVVGRAGGHRGLDRPDARGTVAAGGAFTGAAAHLRGRGVPAGARGAARGARARGVEHLRAHRGHRRRVRGAAGAGRAGPHRPAAARVAAGRPGRGGQPGRPRRDRRARDRGRGPGSLPRPRQGRREVPGGARAGLAPRLPHRRPRQLRRCGPAVRRPGRRPGQARRAAHRAGRDRHRAARAARCHGRRGRRQEDEGGRGDPGRLPRGRRRGPGPRRRPRHAGASGCPPHWCRCWRSWT